jgi:hypothetical protein
MTDSTDSGKKPYENINVEADLLTEIKKLQKEHPQRCPIRTYVLEAVHDNIYGQWEERLSQTKNNQTGKRIILIPYNLGNSHWIGILILFKEDG